MAERAAIAVAEGWLAQQGRLKETITIGQIAFISGRVAVPVGPVNPLAARVANAILELALRLPLEHGPQHPVCLFGLADDILSSQEVQELTGRDAPVLVVAEGVRAVFPLWNPQAVREEEEKEEKGTHPILFGTIIACNAACRKAGGPTSCEGGFDEQV